MRTAAPEDGGPDVFRSATRNCTSATSAGAAQEEFIDLPAFRGRLIAARRRLVERIAGDFPADRRFPDSGWTRMLADIQAAIQAVDAGIAEGVAPPSLLAEGEP